ncbi:hypothetical protein FGO68_gene15622 [Halteria grandinella]|uniref:Uncharacterized protein n=1 Tax=Halteria grandinella TaxID=5974 RepID=A0A8J8TB34_HALGN|nr:hypothetical protein FGO68_gene15622 [Halteria grandinella]
MQGEQQTKKDKKVTTPIRQPDASATGSSFGGSEGGSLGNGRSNNVKHFNERERIQEVVRLYSTLESQGGSGGNEDEDYVEELKYQALDKSPDQSRSGAYQYKNTFHSQQQHDQDGVHQNFRILTRLKSFLIGRLFKFNHVILNYQSVTTYIYLAYLLIELIEMLFYVFYKVEIANEFTRPIVESLFAVSGSVGNSGTELLEPETGSNSDFLDLYDPSLEELADLSDANSALNQEQITESTFEIAQYFTFLNFQLYPLQTHSFKGFLALYLTLNVTFYALLIVIYGLGDRLFMMAKRDEIKDMYKYGTKALSVIMASYLFIFQIPMVSINLQGYLCEEDPDDIYVLENVECGSVSNQIMVVFSTVTLILYISFLFIQTMIYNSCDFETSIPWASVEDSHSHARVIWKLIISFGFMFDKAGEYRQIVSFISAAFGLLISYHRLTSAQIFNRSVHYLSVASDLLASWLYICLPIHQYFSSEISVASLVTIVLCGSVLIIVCVVFSEMRNQHEIIHAQCDEETIKARSPSQAHRIIYQLTRLIISANESDKLMLQGLLYSHIAECKNQKCSCDEFTLEFDEKALRIAMEQKGIDLFGLKKQMVSKYFSDTHFTNTNAASVVDQKQSGAFPVSFGNLSSDVLNNQALNITGGQKSAEGQGGSQLNTREIKIHQFEGLANPPSALASNDREFLDSNRGQRGVNQLVVGESGQRTSWYERYQNNPVQNAFGLQDIGGALSSIPVNDDSLLTSHRLASARNQLSGIGKQPSDKDAPAPLVDQIERCQPHSSTQKSCLWWWLN